MRLGRGSIRAAWHARHLPFASPEAPYHLDNAFSFPTGRSSCLLAPLLATFLHLGRTDERPGAPFTATGSCRLDGAPRFRRSPPVAQRCTAGKQAWRCAVLSPPAAARLLAPSSSSGVASLAAWARARARGPAHMHAVENSQPRGCCSSS